MLAQPDTYLEETRRMTPADRGPNSGSCKDSSGVKDELLAFDRRGGGVVANSEESFHLEGVDDTVVLIGRLYHRFGEDGDVRP